MLLTIENNNFIRNEKFVIFLVEEIDMCDWKIKKKLSFNLEKLNYVIKNHINRVEIIRNFLISSFTRITRRQTSGNAKFKLEFTGNPPPTSQEYA